MKLSRQALRFIAIPFVLIPAALIVWRPAPNDGSAHAQLRKDFTGLPMEEAVHPESSQPVLRVRGR